MARSLNGTNSDYLSQATALITANPITFACWFQISSLAATENTLVSISKASSGTSWQLLVRSSGVLRAKPSDDTFFANSPSSTATVSTNTWAHGCAVFTSNSSRSIYLNGGNKATASLTVNPATPTVTNIGSVNWGGIRESYFPGLIAEVGIWNVALTDDEVSSLAKGMSPLLIRRENLVEYVPLLGKGSPEVGLKGTPFTVTGTTAAAHPRIYYAGVQQIGLAPNALIPVYMNQYRQRLAG